MSDPGNDINKTKADPITRPLDEVLNSATHGVGAVLSLIGLIILVLRAVQNGDINQIISFSIYGFSLTALYLSSSLYHGLQSPRARKFFRVMDHSTIYLLIAGSYTPFLLVGVQGRISWIMLVIIWALAFIGIAFKIFLINRFMKASVLVYLLMGWLSVVMLKELAANVHVSALIWLGAGGLLYTVGVVFYSLKKNPFMHVVWHFFVLGGSLCHYIAVFMYLS